MALEALAFPSCNSEECKAFVEASAEASVEAFALASVGAFGSWEGYRELAAASALAFA